MSAITDKNMRDNNGRIYVSAGRDANGQHITVCPTTGRRFVARITVCSGGFMVRQPNDGSIQQYEWNARGGRAGLVAAVQHLAKRTLETSFAGRHGVVGFVREQSGCELPCAQWEGWGYTRDNAPCGEVSIAAPYFDVLVPHG